MVRKTRIPRAPVEFNVFINRSNDYMSANAARLGILPEEVTRWQEFADNWNLLFPKYMDRRMGYTMAIKDELHAIITEVVSFDKEAKFIDRIASSLNATSEDYEVFGIRKNLPKSSNVPAIPIAEFVKAIILPVSGGTVSVRCIGSKTQRSAIIERADSVQFVYVVGTTPPASPEDAGLTKEVSSRAKFTLNVGALNLGKTLYIYFRWYNVKHPEYAGPWSMLYSSMII